MNGIQVLDETCFYCGAELLTADRRDLQAKQRDHYVPKVLGGSSEPSNMVSACRACNAAKRGSPPEEWAVACYRSAYGAIARLEWLIGPAATKELADKLEAFAPGVPAGETLSEHLDAFGKVA